MKKFIVILILILTFQTLSKADDIRDFQVEGISLGDSLLDYFTKEEIEKKKINSYMYPSERFEIISIPKLSTSSNYAFVQISIKPKDKKFLVYAIDGSLDFKNRIKDCYKKQDEIVDELTSLFKSIKIEDRGIFNHNIDKSGKTKVSAVNFIFNSGDIVNVGCVDWSKKYENDNNWQDNLKVSIVTKEFLDFTSNEAFK